MHWWFTNIYFGLLLIEIIFLPLFLLWWVKSELSQPLKPVWAEVQLTNIEEERSMRRPGGMEVSR